MCPGPQSATVLFVCFQASGGEIQLPICCEEQDERRFVCRIIFVVILKRKNGAEILMLAVLKGVLCIYYRDLSEPWWLQRSDVRCSDHVVASSDSDHLDYETEKDEKKSARFTEYSMTSSVIPRSEGKVIANDFLNLLFLFVFQD